MGAIHTSTEQYKFVYALHYEQGYSHQEIYDMQVKGMINGLGLSHNSIQTAIRCFDNALRGNANYSGYTLNFYKACVELGIKTPWNQGVEQPDNTDVVQNGNDASTALNAMTDVLQKFAESMNGFLTSIYEQNAEIMNVTSKIKNIVEDIAKLWR